MSSATVDDTVDGAAEPRLAVDATPRTTPLGTTQSAARNRWRRNPPSTVEGELRVLPIPCSLPPAIDLEEFLRRRPPPGQGYLEIDFSPARPVDPQVPESASDWNLPDPTQWAGMIARVVLETMDGRPAPAGLRGWISPPLLARVQRRRALAVASRRRPRVVRVRAARAMYPRERVAEVSLVLEHDDQPRALALRLEGDGHRWVMTAFDLG